MNREQEKEVSVKADIVEKQKISTEYLKKNPRIGKIGLEEERFFAYEKQSSHN